MSLEKAIQKLTEVISAATPRMGVPDGSPIGREYVKKNPCTQEYPPGHPSYCFCFKQANPEFSGACYFKSGNSCYQLIYRQTSMNPVRTKVDCATGGSSGIDGGPDMSPIT